MVLSWTRRVAKKISAIRIKSQIIAKINVKNIGSPLLYYLQLYYNTWRKRCQTLYSKLLNSFKIQNTLAMGMKKPAVSDWFFKIYLNLSSRHHPLKELRGRHVVSIQFFVLE